MEKTQSPEDTARSQLYWSEATANTAECTGEAPGRGGGIGSQWGGVTDLYLYTQASPSEEWTPIPVTVSLVQSQSAGVN